LGRGVFREPDADIALDKSLRCNSNTHTHSYADCNSYPYSHGYSEFNPAAYSYTEEQSGAEASSNPGAAPVVFAYENDTHCSTPTPGREHAKYFGARFFECARGLCSSSLRSPNCAGAPTARRAIPEAEPCGNTLRPGLVGPDLPSTGVRMVGVYFLANGKFYAMGGRSMDGVGNEFVPV
jgi:hypothetical protein